MLTGQKFSSLERNMKLKFQIQTGYSSLPDCEPSSEVNPPANGAIVQSGGSLMSWLLARRDTVLVSGSGESVSGGG